MPAKKTAGPKNRNAPPPEPDFDKIIASERGLFICMEGGDGSGKSTQVERMAHFFKGRQLKALTLSNPGTTPLGKALRQILLSKDIPADHEELLLMFTAARSSLAKEIREAVMSGVHVIVDRWLLSTLVYQGELGGISADVIMQLHRDYVDLDPDLYVVIDVPAETARTRLDADRPIGDRFTDDGVEKLYKLYDAYRSAAKKMNVPTVDGTRAPEDVHRKIVELILGQGLAMLPKLLRNAADY